MATHHQNLKRPKKLIVCCDGTWLNSDRGYQWGSEGSFQTPSNVTRIARAIAPEDLNDRPQIVYYQAGVGTGASFWDHFIGGGTGSGLGEHIREAYAFLVNNYLGPEACTPVTERNSTDQLTDVGGDDIYLIGFSRGAFTARSVGGLIGAVGLLEKSSMDYFYDIFEDWENAGVKGYKPRLPRFHPEFKLEDAKPEQAEEYIEKYKKELDRLRMTRTVNIKAIGVWDTVGALGIPISPWLQRLIGSASTIHHYKFYNTHLDTCVENAFQALALDEERSAFAPSLWERPEGCNTKLKQVWFPGVHSNVGGSYQDASLANITLAWMMSQLDPFIHFEEHYLMDQYEATQRFCRMEQRSWPIEWEDGTLESDPRIVEDSTALINTTPTSPTSTRRAPPQDLSALPLRQGQTHHPIPSPRFGRPPIYERMKRFLHHTAANLGLVQHSTRRHPTSWALGKIYDSCSLFYKLMGWWSVRTPGRYHKVEFLTWVPQNEFLERTNESIHCSVRARMDFGGLDDHQSSPYAPEALKDWRLEDGHRYHDNVAINTLDGGFFSKQKHVRWVYKGKERSGVSELKEDEPGVWEKKLMNRNKTIAERIGYLRRATQDFSSGVEGDFTARNT